MSNLITKSFTNNATWVCPAGVTNVRATSFNTTKMQISNGGDNFQMIESTGRVYQWGINTNGQLGVGDTTSRSSPSMVLGGITFVSIFSTTTASYGLTAQGQIYAWGNNTKGELGVGDVVPRSSPVLVLGGLTFQSVVSSVSAVLGLTTSGAVYGWGQNTGVGDATPKSSPILVLGGVNFSSISIDTAGRIFFGLTASGALYAWGLNINGELGVGDTTTRSSPVLVLGGLTFQSVYLNQGSSGVASNVFGLTTAGILYSWGKNTNGELGLGDVNPRSSPVAVLGGLTFKSFVCSGTSSSGGEGVAYGLTTSGALYAWGSNGYGQLGVGDVVYRSSPILVLGGLTFSSVYSGESFGNAFALTPAGALYGWGLNGGGCLGNGNTIARSSPVAVLGGLVFSNFLCNGSSSGGNGNSFGITGTGQVYGWGTNDRGQLGVGDTTSRSSPVLALGPPAATQPIVTTQSIAVVPGTSYAIAIKQFVALFGSTPVGQGPVNTLTLEYYA